tara:strand:- start:9 stop:314 length:306 start_codon:yes stop_codon:yes gene_type:complete
MRYLYTNEPDKHCHEVEKGIYGRPVHTSDQSKLLRAGWSNSVEALRGTDHVRIEKETNEKASQETEVSERDVWAAAYEHKLGAKPHHKMKLDTIRKKVEEA